MSISVSCSMSEEAAVLMWTAEARRAAAVRSLEGWATTTGTPDCNGWA